MARLTKSVILYLASRQSRCATLDELVEHVSSIKTSRARDLRIAVLKSLSKLIKEGYVSRSNIKIEGKRKRIYCLR